MPMAGLEDAVDVFVDFPLLTNSEMRWSALLAYSKVSLTPSSALTSSTI